MQNNKIYTVEITADGSPSLRYRDAEAVDSEQMHHSGGAASETIYIYGEAIKEAHKKCSPDQLNYLVLGLGLGYIEILISLLSDLGFKRLISFEKDEELIKAFKAWLESPQPAVYDEVYSSLNQKLTSKIEVRINKENFKTTLQSFLYQDRFHLYPALDDAHKVDPHKYHVICYDAFSKKTNEELWTFDFLDSFIQNYCDEFCVFSTYAKTGDLARALKKNGFHILKRKGFSNKRDCTLAIRN